MTFLSSVLIGHSFTDIPTFMAGQATVSHKKRTSERVECGAGFLKRSSDGLVDVVVRLPCHAGLCFPKSMDSAFTALVHLH